LTEAQAGNVNDPESVEYKALKSAALSACQAQAADLGLVSENCEDNLGEPQKDGSCMLEEGECGIVGGETGGAGDPSGGFDTPSDLVACDGDLCEVQQALIDQVLQADAATFDADGTTLAPHNAATGEQDGWEFGGITAGNLGDALGFQNGDVVTEVGGEPFDSWNAVIDAANAALHADVVEVVFIRDNRVLTRRYARI
jgi:hypothetical protein